MGRLIRGQGQAGRADSLRRRRPGALIVEVSRRGELSARVPAAQVRVRLADRGACERIEQAVARALSPELEPPGRGAPARRWVRLRTLKRAGSVDVEGALVAVMLTQGNTTRLASIVEALERRGAAGVQVCWDGREPPRDRAERPVFSLLESRRGKGGVPVLLSPSAHPLEVLERLAAGEVLEQAAARQVAS